MQRYIAMYSSRWRAKFGLRPVYQIDIMLLSMIVGPVAFSIAGRTPNLFWVDVVLIALVAFRLLKSSMQGNMLRFRAPPGLGWMTLYVVCILSTLPMAVDFLYSIAVAKLYIMPLILFMLSYSMVRTEKDVQHLLVVMNIIGAILGAFALYNWWQFYTGFVELQSGFAAKDMIQTVTGRSNTVAGVSVLLMPTSIFLLSRNRLELRILGIVSLALLVLSVVFAMSRAAIISAMVGVVLWLLIQCSRRYFPTFKRVLALIILMAFIMSIVCYLFPKDFQQHLVEKFTSALIDPKGDSSSNSRLERWQIILTHIPQAPLGIGVGNYVYLLSDSNISIGGSAHNLYLETLNEVGLVGFFALLGLLFVLGRYMFRLLKTSATEEQRLLSSSLIMAYAIYLVNVFFEPNYYSVVFTYLFWTMMGMGCAVLRARMVGNRDGIDITES